MSAGREFHVCGAATENARRASSVRLLPSLPVLLRFFVFRFIVIIVSVMVQCGKLSSP